MFFFKSYIPYIDHLFVLTRQQRQFAGIQDEAGVQVQVICEDTTNTTRPLTCGDELLLKQALFKQHM